MEDLVFARAPNKKSTRPKRRSSLRKSHRMQRLALTPTDAAEALGCSRDFFDKHIAPELRRMARVARSVSRRPESILESGVEAAIDKAYLERPEVRKILGQSLAEAFRDGSRGAAWEMGLYARPWAFRLEDIRTPVHLWHGEEDANAPISMGRYLATSIPECRATFYPGEGHLHFVDRLPEILTAVSSRASEGNTQIGPSGAG